MKRLSAPLRLTWDWDWPSIAHPPGEGRRLSPERVRVIGAEIVRSRVLMLEVGYPDPEALRAGELGAALAGFEGSLSLVLTPAAAATLVDRKSWEALGVEEVWLDATPGVGGAVVLPKAWPAVRFYLTGGNLNAVATGIERAVDGGATAISLPNLPLFGSVLREAETVTPDARQLMDLAARIAVTLRDIPTVDLRVHHYGLWQALRAAGVQPRGEHAPGAGCQAGSALAYIDPSGILYPCASLPIPLARVDAGSVPEAWSGPDLASLREKIARLPETCTACPSEPTCRGGCRGWAHYLSGSWNTPGPDCLKP